MILGLAVGGRSLSPRTGEEFFPLQGIAGAFPSGEQEGIEAVAGG